MPHEWQEETVQNNNWVLNKNTYWASCCVLIQDVSEVTKWSVPKLDRTETTGGFTKYLLVRQESGLWQGQEVMKCRTWRGLGIVATGTWIQRGQMGPEMQTGRGV